MNRAHMSKANKEPGVPPAQPTTIRNRKRAAMSAATTIPNQPLGPPQPPTSKSQPVLTITHVAFVSVARLCIVLLLANPLPLPTPILLKKTL